MTGCEICFAKCPVKVPDAYNELLGTHKAIYLPFPQAVPKIAVIDAERCLYLTKGNCGNCAKACDAGAGGVGIGGSRFGSSKSVT